MLNLHKQRIMALNELGIKYHTDKSSLLHDYLKEYEKHFTNPSEIKYVCEIGLQRSGKWKIQGKELPSVKMWLEFFPNAFFYGFDLKDLRSKTDRSIIIQGNQGDEKDLHRLWTLLPNEVDFIIDDGSHEAQHQIKTFEKLFPKLKKGGVYIIEDCNPVVQKDLPKEEKIHSLIAPYLKIYQHTWVASKTAGKQSSLIIVR